MKTGDRYLSLEHVSGLPCISLFQMIGTVRLPPMGPRERVLQCAADVQPTSLARTPVTCFESPSPGDFPKEEGMSRTLREVTHPRQACFMLLDLFTPSLLMCCSDTAQNSSLENNPEKLIQA